MRTGSRSVKRWCLAAWNAARASSGYVAFRFTGRAPHTAIMGLRGLFTADPRLPRALSRGLSVLHRSRMTLPVEGILGSVDQARASTVAEALRDEGFYIFPERLDRDTTTALLELARSLPRVASLEAGEPETMYDETAIVSSRYLCRQSDLLNAPIVQHMLVDESLAAIADTYLRCDSVQTDVAAWQSVIFGTSTLSAASQMFHSDRDHMQFVKFFVYLTDVTTGTGPHVFVRRSHRLRAPELRRDVRYSDEDVARNYPAADILELVRPSGTIMAVDTSGLHKGKLPDTGERWILELEFGSSAFGPSGLRFDLRTATPELERRVLSDPRKFARLTLPHATTQTSQHSGSTV